MGAAERYMREDPLFAGGGAGEGSKGGRGYAGLPSNIRHTILTVPKVKKFEILRRFLNTQPFPDSVMIFVNDPMQVTWLTERLEEVGVVAAPLSGESSKDDRSEIMRRLQDKRIAMVVTTEMAARGLDVSHLTHVINYDLPTDGEHYVHRAGRCGRAGRPGIVVNIVTPESKFVVGKFANQLGVSFEDAEVQGGRFWSVTRTDPSAPVRDVSKKSDSSSGSESRSGSEPGSGNASSRTIEELVDQMISKSAGTVDQKVETQKSGQSVTEEVPEVSDGDKSSVVGAAFANVPAATTEHIGDRMSRSDNVIDQAAATEAEVESSVVGLAANKVSVSSSQNIQDLDDLLAQMSGTSESGNDFIVDTDIGSPGAEGILDAKSVDLKSVDIETGDNAIRSGDAGSGGVVPWDAEKANVGDSALDDDIRGDFEFGRVSDDSEADEPDEGSQFGELRDDADFNDEVMGLDEVLADDMLVDDVGKGGYPSDISSSVGGGGSAFSIKVPDEASGSDLAQLTARKRPFPASRSQDSKKMGAAGGAWDETPTLAEDDVDFDEYDDDEKYAEDDDGDRYFESAGGDGDEDNVAGITKDPEAFWDPEDDDSERHEKPPKRKKQGKREKPGGKSADLKVVNQRTGELLSRDKRSLDQQLGPDDTFVISGDHVLPDQTVVKRIPGGMEIQLPEAFVKEHYKSGDADDEDWEDDDWGDGDWGDDDAEYGDDGDWGDGDWGDDYEEGEWEDGGGQDNISR